MGHRSSDGPRPAAPRGGRRRVETTNHESSLRESLAAYLAVARRWGGVVDLFGGGDRPRTLERLVEDSLAALPWVPEEGRLLDVGSGNGIPAVPLLLARRGLRGVLLEPRERRWAFLRELDRELGCGADVRRERLAAHAGEGYDLITVRGLAMDLWWRDASARLANGGTMLWWTSREKGEWAGSARGEGAVVRCRRLGGGGGLLVVLRPRST
jgi:16S rRNA G527 N7-methylase RsmG